jgi:hypothetical protein
VKVGDLVFSQYWDKGCQTDHGVLAQINFNEACAAKFPYLVYWFRLDGKPCFPPRQVWCDDSEFTNERR